MAAHSVTIYAAEMIGFLEARGFRRMDLRDTKEIVFGKRYDWERREGTEGKLIYSLPLTLRVYTSVDIRTGSSRGTGDDAIRASVWTRRLDASGSSSAVFMIGGAKRVHRVENWKLNLQNRLDNWIDLLKPFCPECGAPMILITPKRGQKWHPFYGCVRFANGCRGSLSVEDGNK